MLHVCRELEALLRNDPRAKGLVQARLQSDMFYERTRNGRGIILRDFGTIASCAFLWETDYTPGSINGVHAERIFELGCVYEKSGCRHLRFMEQAVLACTQQLACSERAIAVTKSRRVARFVRYLGWKEQPRETWLPIVQYREHREDPHLMKRKIFLSPNQWES